MLVRLLKFRTPGQPVMVVTMLSGGSFLPQLKALGIPVYELPFNQPFKLFARVVKTLAAIKNFKPNVVVGWMYHGNLLAWLLQKIFCRQAALIWNIRGSMYGIRYEKITSRPVIYLNVWLSRYVHRILYNGELSRTQHQAIGFAPARTGIVYNGFDLSKLFPDAAATQKLRAEWGVGSAPVIGMVARYHPMKDHANFLRAAAILSRTHPAVRYVLAGLNVTVDNVELKALCHTLGIADKVIFLGERSDGDMLSLGFTIATLSSSRSENFPNVLGEAMACGVPCVATRVGDVPVVIGDTGIVVPPSDPVALAAGWAKLLDLPPVEFEILSDSALRRMQELFTIQKAVENYEHQFALVRG